MAAPAPTSQREMRQRNLSRVLYAVAESGPASRASVAARIGLTRAAVSTLVDELLRAGLLTELGPARASRESRVGRPGSALALTSSGPCGVGAEIGVDHLAACAMDLTGAVRVRTHIAFSGHRSAPASVLARLAELVGEVCADADAAGLRPSGLTIAVPGLVSRGTSAVVRAPNLGWDAIDLAGHLPADRLPPLPLTVDNEANLGALAELWLGGGGTERNFIHVSAEIGIGAAVVLDGELLRGTRGFAGELGHVPVRPGGPECPCGGRGCLERYAGESAVLGAAGIPGHASLDRTAALAALADHAAAADPEALKALRGAGKALGIALSGAVNLLDPGALVLGGTLARFTPWLLPSLEKELARRTAAPGPLPTVAVSALGPDGPLLGAAHTAVRAVFDDPLAHATT